MSVAVETQATVAALYVDPNGVYANLPGVEVWDEARDARRYAGPWPVVAHPPCARWCRLAGLVAARFGHKRGKDGGCPGLSLGTPVEFRDALLRIARESISLPAGASGGVTGRSAEGLPANYQPTTSRPPLPT